MNVLGRILFPTEIHRVNISTVSSSRLIRRLSDLDYINASVEFGKLNPELLFSYEKLDYEHTCAF